MRTCHPAGDLVTFLSELIITLHLDFNFMDILFFQIKVNLTCILSFFFLNILVLG